MNFAFLLIVGLVGIMAFGIGQAKPNSSNSTQAENSVSQSTQPTNEQLIDVRTPEEFAESHVEGAVNIELSRITNISEDELSKEKDVQLYCRSGNRSAQAASILKEAGYKVEDLGSLQSAADKTKRRII